MILRESKNSPSRLTDEALSKIISEARTTIPNIPSSSAEVADRLSRFNELYKPLATKPDAAALIYKDPVTASPAWSAVGNKLVVGRSPKHLTNARGSVLPIQDQEMSRQHFEIILTNDGLYLLNDLQSLNGTYVNGVRDETRVLIGGSEIRAGNTYFIFTGI